MDKGLIHNSLVTKRKGSGSEGYVPINENQICQNGRVLLSEIPDINKGVVVKVGGYNFREILNNTPDDREFYIDYRLGIVYLNKKYNGSSVDLSYMGAGVMYFPASRIWTKIDAWGEVVNTLADDVDAIVNASSEANKIINNMQSVMNMMDERFPELKDISVETKQMLTDLEGTMRELSSEVDKINSLSENYYKIENSIKINTDKADKLLSSIQTQEHRLDRQSERVEKSGENLDKLTSDVYKLTQTAKDIDSEIRTTIRDVNNLQISLKSAMDNASQTMDELNDKLAELDFLNSDDVIDGIYKNTQHRQAVAISSTRPRDDKVTVWIDTSQPTARIWVRNSSTKNFELIESNKLTDSSRGLEYTAGDIKDIDERISKIVGNAPENLDTLEKLAEALDNDESFASTITKELSNKVDKEKGKGLSTNDFSNMYKLKLDGIEDGANKVTKVGQLENDAGYITLDEVPEVDLSDIESSISNIEKLLETKADKIEVREELDKLSEKIDNLDIPEDVDLKPVFDEIEYLKENKADKSYVENATQHIMNQLTQMIMLKADKSFVDKEIERLENLVNDIDVPEEVDLQPIYDEIEELKLLKSDKTTVQSEVDRLEKMIGELAGGGEIDLSDYAKKKDIPKSLSQLTNDTGYITIADIPEVDLTDINKQLVDLQNNKANKSDVAEDINKLQQEIDNLDIPEEVDLKPIQDSLELLKEDKADVSYVDEKFDEIMDNQASQSGIARSSTIVIANYDSHENSKENADIVINKGENAAEKINEAIQSLRGVGGEVKLMEGKYNLEYGIAVNVDGVHLTGISKATVLVQNKAWKDNPFANNRRNVIDTWREDNRENVNVEISNIYVKGANISDSGGFNCFGSSKITNCISENSSRYGFRCAGSSKITNCTSENSGSDGFYCTDSSKITNCISENSGSYGFSCAGSSKITNCISENSGSHGFSCIGSSKITNCISENSGSYGFRCFGSFKGVCGHNTLIGDKLNDNSSSPAIVQYNIIQEEG